MVGAALGMPDDDRGPAGVGDHLGRNIAGVRPGWLGVTVLAADRHRGAPRALRQSAARRSRADTPGCRAGASSLARPSTIRAVPPAEAKRPFIFQLPATSGRRSARAMSNPAFPEPRRAGSRAGARAPDRARSDSCVRRPCGLVALRPCRLAALGREPCEEGCPLGLARKGGARLVPVLCLPTVLACRKIFPRALVTACHPRRMLRCGGPSSTRRNPRFAEGSLNHG